MEKSELLKLKQKLEDRFGKNYRRYNQSIKHLDKKYYKGAYTAYEDCIKMLEDILNANK